MISDNNIARGIFLLGSRTSPPTAAIKSNPCKAMKLYPIACTKPPQPDARNGRNSAVVLETGCPVSTQNPPMIKTEKTATLATLIQAPPPDVRNVIKPPMPTVVASETTGTLQGSPSQCGTEP